MLKESFIAPTPEEAYKLAIKKYGSIDNFKVVAARQYMKDNEFVSEITIEVDENSYYASIGVDEEDALINEINILKEKMARMKSTLTTPKDTQVIEAVKEVLVDRGLQDRWVSNMLDPFVGTQVAQDKDLLLSFILEEIEEALVISKYPIDKKRVLFVGPTGVGKSTTIAKIAGFSMQRGIKANDIAFLNLDTFKAGAYEQLDFYAKRMNIAHYHPTNLKELKFYLETLRDKKLILIDTTGSSPYDFEKIFNTIEFSNDIKDVSSYLVVSTTSKYEDLMESYNNFSFLNLKSVIITKVDETKTIGNIIAFLIDTKLPLSFITTGQEVPRDLEIATKRKILDMFIGEIENSKEE
ncbi:MAG: flagellar biosynthesis protein FlhF [Epsilonproteobacteria bacterium]|nr:flagellar biosynthesis protein FlhF [Campylobacterota bacterium]